jgi:hypothetical protein
LGDSAFEIVPATNIVEAHVTLEIGVGFWLVPENKTKTSFFSIFHIYSRDLLLWIIDLYPPFLPPLQSL